MAKDRLELHEKLCEILGSRNCYFNPPTGLTMEFPCIRYTCEGINEKFADNQVYLKTRRYNLILIDYNPDSEIADRLYKLPYCHSGRFYVSNNLNHFPFEVYW